MPVSQTEEMVSCFGHPPTPAKACRNLVAVDLGTVFFSEGWVAETGSTRSLAAGLLSGCRVATFHHWVKRDPGAAGPPFPCGPLHISF